MMSFVQPLHQNLSSRILVSSLLSSRNEKQRILFLAKGGHVTTVTSIKNKMLFVVCIWIYICHTQVPIRLCQNNIIIVIFRTIGRQLRSCVQANPERWGKYCLQLNFIHLPSFSIYHLSITSFCLYHYFCHLISGHQVALAVGLEYLHTIKYSLALSLSSFSCYLHNHVVNFYSCQFHFIFICLERNSKRFNKISLFA